MRLAVIGTGSMAKGHVSSYQEIEGVEVVACCDLVEDRLAEFSQKWRIPRTYQDFRRMLDQEKPDGVSIVTPDAAHATVTVGVLEAGVPVLCEKPMASTLQEAEAMHAAWERAGVVAMINYSKRNSSGLQQARRFIRDGGMSRARNRERQDLEDERARLRATARDAQITAARAATTSSRTSRPFRCGG